MSALVLLPVPGNESMADRLAAQIHADIGRLETRRFPDGETYLKIDTDLARRDIAIVCTLDHPDDKLLPLIFAADTARDLDAASVGLIAPYLAYMRQDRRFHPGEAISSRSFARVLSGTLDWLVTIDPHLHRYRSLGELYMIPTRVLHAAPALVAWIKQNVAKPILVGPDAESAQWVSEAAAQIDAPFFVLEKIRNGDRDVEVCLPAGAVIGDRTPVLLDDTISSGETMLAAVRALRQVTQTAPYCVAVHGIFAEDAEAKLARECARVVSTNTIPHETNAIDISALLAAGVADCLARPTA